MPEPRPLPIDDAVRKAAETVAPGALAKGGDAARRALDLVACNALRALCMDQVQKANSGHPGGPCSSMDFAWVLHRYFLRTSRDPEWRDRDRFVLSGGHMSTLLYSLLHLQGRIGLDDLKNFRQLDSRTQGHPVRGFAPGIETSTGPLGQGFANAVGMALAQRLERETFGAGVSDHRIWVLATDGDLQEGLCREAAQLAGHWRLGNLKVFFDSNDIQLASPTRSCWSEDVGVAFRAAGWRVLELKNGHDHEALEAACAMACDEAEKPVLIIGKTVIAKGTRKEGKVETHGSPLGAETVAAYKADLGLPAAQFWVPPFATAAIAERMDAGDAAQDAWAARLAAARAADPAWAGRWDLFFAPDRAARILAIARREIRSLSFEGPMATRVSAGKALAKLAQAIPCLVGGSADLANSTKTDLFEKAVGYFGEPRAAGTGPGRGLHYGVREHAMASISNGLALHGGWIPFAGTFLVFSDYLRGALRLAAINKIGVVHVLTHDSIFLGEDGETHQPVEHVESLRLIPGTRVLRPADAYEAAECWVEALAHVLSDAPGAVALVLSRQDLPTMEGGFARAGGVARGGYLVDGDPVAIPDVELVASGSELALAREVGRRLAAQGLGARVVSMPCREIFAALPEAERARVLHPSCPFRVVLEAGRVSGWEGALGVGFTEPVGLEGYGQSAPAAQLAERYGLTTEQVTARVAALMKRRVELLDRLEAAHERYRLARLPASSRAQGGGASVALGGGARNASHEL